jgi:hypothetical protein
LNAGRWDDEPLPFRGDMTKAQKNLSTVAYFEAQMMELEA